MLFDTDRDPDELEIWLAAARSCAIICGNC